MNDFPVPARAGFETPASRSPASADRAAAPHDLGPAEETAHEVIWAEAEGRLIDLAADARNLSSALHDRETSATPSCRILVVDDEPGIRDMLSQLLHAAGHRVACADDGEAGWSALCAGGFHLLITDHEMPRLTGLDLLRRVRNGHLDLPVIMISGEMPWHEPDLSRLLAPEMAVEKPFPLATLLATVHHALTNIAGAGEIHRGETTISVNPT